MNNILSILNGATIGFITKHSKEKILEPIFRDTFNANITRVYFDTDMLGTFAGEIERPGSQEETLHLKIEAAQKISDYQFLIASEGSFYPHPDAPFITLNTELVLFKNRIAGWEVTGRFTTYHVTAATITTQQFAAILSFAERVQFPEQGIILMSDEVIKSERNIFKDIGNEEDLYASFSTLQQRGYRQIIAETDMRAMRNPLRRSAILKAGEDLVQNLTNDCPACLIPGFAVQATSAGLPCCLCGNATKQVAYLQYKCQHCQYAEQQPVAQQCADPGVCDYCNP